VRPEELVGYGISYDRNGWVAPGALTAAGGPDQARVPRGNGRISGRWLDMPGAILDDLLDQPTTPKSSLMTVDTEAGDLRKGDGVLVDDVVHEVVSAEAEGDSVRLLARNTKTNETKGAVVEKRSIWKKVVLALSAVAVLAGLATGGAALGGNEPEADRPQAETTSQVVEQQVPAPKTAKGYQKMWDALDNAEWGGADISISTPLKDGRRLWLYGDTLSENNGFVHSTAIVQDGGTLHVSNGGKQLLPNDEPSGGRENIYWIEKAQTREDGTVAVWAAPMSIGTDSVWDFRRDDPRSRVAIVSVDDEGNANFDRWAGFRAAPPDSMIDHGGDDMEVVGPNHYTYQGFTHDIRLANGEYLRTVNQNWDDGFENHRNADGSFRFKDWAPIFSSVQGRPGKFSVDQARVPKGNGKISGRWLDMPGAVLDDLLDEPEPYLPQMRPATAVDKAAFKEKHGKSIPPSWKDVEVDLDDRASLVARGKDKQGRTVRLYSQAHHDRQAAKKFQRLKEVGLAVPRIEDALASVDGDPTKAAARLMFNEGVRVGSTDEQLGKVQAYGATTLKTSHATKTPNGVRLSFIAKEGIPVAYDIDDPELVKYITQRLDEASGDEQLFKGTDSNKTMRFLRDASGVAGIKNHDLRTLLANRLAAAALAEITPPPPGSPKEFAALRRRIGEVVSQQLRNKPAQALASYINPAIFAAIKEA
jgi:DNA topoisomerase IB